MVFSLGRKIFLARKELDMTQDELAERIGIARNTISFWERDVHSPDEHIIKKLKEG